MKELNQTNHNRDYLAAGLVALSALIYNAGFIYSN